MVGIIILGVIGLFAVNLIQNVQNSNELDYYLLEETTESAMLDAVDVAYYRESGGQIRVDREKFLESFVRRFAQNVDGSRDYDIKIIDFNETPPKVSVQVDSSTVATFNGESAGVTNKVDGIIESRVSGGRLTGIDDSCN